MRVMRLPRTIEIAVLLALGAGLAAPLAAQREPSSRRGWLGFSFGASAFGEGPAMVRIIRTDTMPVVVGEVLKGSPADRAGMEPGDTLLRVNGERATIEGVQQTARRLHPGDTVRLEVRRGGHNQTLTLHAAERPAYLAMDGMPPMVFGRDFNMTGDSIFRTMQIYLDSARKHTGSIRIEKHDSLMIVYGPRGRADTMRLAPLERGMMRMRIGADSALAGLQDHLYMLQRDGMPGFDVEITGRRAIAGASLQELNSQLAEYFGVREGLLVERVTAGTPAARAGLQAGDVVTAADGRPVGDISDLRRALRGREGTVKLDVQRKGKHETVSVKWP